MKSPVLVTGGTGFLGRHLVRALCEDGHQVRILSRASSSLRTPVQPGVEVVTGDLLDPASLRTAVSDVQTVFHLAGRLPEPGVPAGLYRRLHVDGTRHLLEACREQPALNAVVHCSTTEVLGPTGLNPAGEDAPRHPSNAYERSKAEGELLALEAARQEGLPVSVARPALMYGPGDRHRAGWFRAIQAGAYHVVGRGDNLLHPVFVGDVVEGLLRCAEHREARGRVYHLVGDEPIPIVELAEAVARAVQRPLPRTHLPRALAYATAALMESLPALTRSRVAFLTENRAYSGGRAWSELGFVPRVPLARGLARTVDWYRRNGLL